MEKIIEVMRVEFVGFLYDMDIRNENGLKTLGELIKEYPEEYENFQAELFEALSQEEIKPLQIKDVLVLTAEDEQELTDQKRREEADDRDRSQYATEEE